MLNLFNGVSLDKIRVDPIQVSQPGDQCYQPESHGFSGFQKKSRRCPRQQSGQEGGPECPQRESGLAGGLTCVIRDLGSIHHPIPDGIRKVGE